MAKTVTTIDKGDLICWVTRDDETYIVWDVGVAQMDCNPKTEWAQIKFKRLGLTDYPVEQIVMVPINYLDANSALEKRLRKQQGNKCWCIRFKDMD